MLIRDSYKQLSVDRKDSFIFQSNTMRLLLSCASLLVVAGPLSVSGHANIVWPHPWFDQGGDTGDNKLPVI